MKMSCYHCYSRSVRNDDLIDKIVEHGERLKNSMIETILRNQPKLLNSINSNEINFNREQLEKIQIYLRGDPMDKNDEIDVLNTLRSISAIELNKITDQIYTNPTTSSNNNNNNSLSKEIIKNSNSSENLEYLKYVDCLKININSIKLNDVGNKKVYVDRLTNITQTFFIEYRIPEILIRNSGRTKSKIDSGLDSSNIERLCARRSYNQEIILFKHSNIYDIVNNLNKLNLEEIEIKFKISYRNFRQKQPHILGHAIFNFNTFKNDKIFNCNQDLIINSDDNRLINVGKLKVSIQLGCERLYFGRDFFDIINRNFGNLNTENFKIDAPELSSRKQISKTPTIDENLQKNDDTPILFCLIYILEAQFNRQVYNSSINCQFDGEFQFSYRSYGLNSNPVYNFHQEVPLIYNERLILKLRDNFIIVEIYENIDNQKVCLIGLAKLSLHQFYLSFRNSVIVKYLKDKHLPVISTDGWVTIYNPFNNNNIGQVSILLALGTKEQIDNILNERSLKKNVVKNTQRNQSIQVEEDIVGSVIKNSKFVRKKSFKTIGIQSDIMEHKDIGSLLNQLINVQKQQRNIHVENSTNTDDVVVVNQPQTLQPQQEQQQQRQPEIRRTSDLLDTLQKALSLDDKNNDDDNNKKDLEKITFKCQILIDGALHLPSRKKCKSKKSKNKTNKLEDILPSTYVTVEITSNNMKITPIIPKCTNPKWDYRCDVELPIEYLTNDQKRLIFKVWRKSTNTTLTPNLQTDFIIGFAAVDLTVLLAGLPTIQGWYNIVDFSNKCHGQINIHITPLENITCFRQQNVESLNNDNKSELKIEIESDINNKDDDSNELLNRTLKRKFIELDEITQRLRLRLSKVTNDDDDDDDTLSHNDDELIDEFEHDINTLCVEDDFDMVDFEKEARNFNRNHLKEIGLLQETLIDDDDNKQQKIDNLVENLNINECSSRHVSGCSNTEMLNQLEQNSRPNIYTTDSFNRTMFERYNWPSTSCSDGGSTTDNNYQNK